MPALIAFAEKEGLDKAKNQEETMGGSASGGAVPRSADNQHSSVSLDRMRDIVDKGRNLSRGYTMGQMGIIFASAFLRTFVIVVVTVLVGMLVRHLIQPLLSVSEECESSESPECFKERRRRTVANALTTVIIVIVAFIGLLFALSSVGVNSTALFTITGAMSIVVGLASQSVLRDILHGFVLLAENQVDVGDWVEVQPRTFSSWSPLQGIVYDMSVRRISLRRIDGTVIYISNSEVAAIGNANRTEPSIRVNLTVGPDEPVERVTHAGQQLCTSLATDSVLADMLTGTPFVVGIDGSDGHSYTLTIQAPCMFNTQWYVGRHIRYEGTKLFQSMGIKFSLSYSSVSLNTKEDGGETERKSVSDSAIQDRVSCS